MLNSFRDLEVDVINKWFENSNCVEYYLSLFHQELFLKEERRIENINQLKSKIKKSLETELKTLSNNQNFKFNLVLLKFLLKELSNITLDNIDELFSSLKNLENYSKFLEEHFEISYLLIKEINDLVKKINELIDEVVKSNNPDKDKILGKLLLYEYSTAFGLKSLYGLLIFLKKLKELEKNKILSNTIKDLLINNIKIPPIESGDNDYSGGIKEVEFENE